MYAPPLGFALAVSVRDFHFFSDKHFNHLGTNNSSGNPDGGLQPHRVTLDGNIHPLARAEFERGAVGAGQPIPRMLLLMKRSEAQQAALLTLMEQQQDKSSANYHAWLTPQDFGTRFGPAEADIQTVTDWLTSQGFSVDKVYSGRNVIEFSGNAGQVQQAFGTDRFANTKWTETFIWPMRRIRRFPQPSHRWWQASFH